MNSESFSRRCHRESLTTKNLTWSRTGQPCREAAFTRLELLAVLTALVLIAGVVIPAFAQSKPRSQQAICFNNLRSIGQAALLFNAEYGPVDQWRVLEANGGTRSHSSGMHNNAWFQFSWLSNGLSNPKVLACPSDSLAKPAKDYSVSSNGGFLSPGYRNNSVSYFLGLDSSALVPDSVLSGDRNMRYDSYNAGCSSGIRGAVSIDIRKETPTVWRGGLHGAFGNILLHDGRVEQTSNQTINRWFKSDIDDYGSIHFMTPRP